MPELLRRFYHHGGDAAAPMEAPVLAGRKAKGCDEPSILNVRITSTLAPATVEVRLSDAPVEHECTGDVIADVNRAGNWIRGLELLGTPGFSLERALAPFDPKPRAASVRSAQVELAVTYDGEADAGFIYLPYASPASVEHDPLLLEYTHSIEDDCAVLGLSADGGLAFVRFRVPSPERLETFLQLFDGHR